MSCGGTITFAPSPLPFAVVASQSTTWKYGIQYDGTSADICAGIASMPANDFPWFWNSVYSMTALGAPCFALQPKSVV